MPLNKYGIYFNCNYKLAAGVRLSTPKGEYVLTLAEAKTLRKNLKDQIGLAEEYEESSGNRSDT